MAKEFSVPIGAAFEKRLAELAWESCSQLAKETVSGKLAMSVDFSGEDTIHLVLETLSKGIVETIRPKVLSQIEEAYSLEQLTRKLAEDLLIRDVLTDASKGLAKRVNGIVEKLVTEQVKTQVHLIIENELGRNFTSFVQEVARAAVESHIANRLSYGKPAVIANKAADTINYAVAASDVITCESAAKS